MKRPNAVIVLTVRMVGLPIADCFRADIIVGGMVVETDIEIGAFMPSTARY